MGLSFFLLTACTNKDKTDFILTETTAQVAEYSEQNDKIYIYICGEVKHPDVYELSNGARVIEAIKAAGGLTKKADTIAVNQALLLTDGQQIYIPHISEAVSPDSTGNHNSDTRVNINSAVKEQLMTLPGIGEAKANLIISDRENNGKFVNIEDIKRIEGIKDGVFLKIKDLIKVE